MHVNISVLGEGPTMDVERLLILARKLVDETPYCVAATVAEDGGANARIVQPLKVQDDWTVNVLTNLRCRKVREIERSGRLTLLYQSEDGRSYACLAGPAEVIEDRELKRAIWSPAADRWNPGGPEDTATVFMRLKADRIELFSVSGGVMPEPEGYSAGVLVRDADGWRYETT
jgi:general stress protein 26